MRKKIIFLAMALMCFANFSKAEDMENVTIDDFTITQGESMQVAVKLVNSHANLTAFSMQLTLPAGLTLTGVEATDRYKGEVTFGNPDANVYNICGFDGELRTITGTTGDFLILTVEASPRFKGGNGKIDNIDFVTPGRQHVGANPDNFKVDSIKSKAAFLADANEDEQVNVSDTMAIVTYILGSSPAVFNELNADVNEEGNINVSDIMAIVNMILSN